MRFGRGRALSLLFPMLLLALPQHLSAMTRSVLLLASAIPLHVLGLLLVLPAFISRHETLVRTALATLFSLDPVCCTGDQPPSFANAGMVLTLTVGLGAFAAIHIWGARP
jgi:hypothetical protein